MTHWVSEAASSLSLSLSLSPNLSRLQDCPAALSTVQMHCLSEVQSELRHPLQQSETLVALPLSDPPPSYPPVYPSSLASRLYAPQYLLKQGMASLCLHALVMNEQPDAAKRMPTAWTKDKIARGQNEIARRVSLKDCSRRHLSHDPHLLLTIFGLSPIGPESRGTSRDTRVHVHNL